MHIGQVESKTDGTAALIAFYGKGFAAVRRHGLPVRSLLSVHRRQHLRLLRNVKTVVQASLLVLPAAKQISVLVGLGQAESLVGNKRLFVVHKGDAGVVGKVDNVAQTPLVGVACRLLLRYVDGAVLPKGISFYKDALGQIHGKGSIVESARFDVF